MGQRLELQALLVNLLGSSNVYFQPPPTLQMEYPCIIYRRDFVEIDYADDNPYTQKKRYLVTVIDRNPDSEIPDKIASLQYAAYDRFYIADNLNHDVFKLFF
jgi:hypothetical protein